MSEISATPSRGHVLSNRRLAWLFAVTLVMVMVAFFVADNFTIVHVRFLTWDLTVRLAWVMLTCLLIGLALGALMGWLLGRGRR